MYTSSLEKDAEDDIGGKKNLASTPKTRYENNNNNNNFDFPGIWCKMKL
jgi:hypothetical protein